MAESTSLKVYRVIEEREDEMLGWQEWREILVTFNESEANERERRFNDSSTMWPERGNNNSRAVLQSTEILITGWS